MKPLSLTVVRKWFSPNESLGELYLSENYLIEKPFCFTLEDEIRPIAEKVMHETAIPYGTYPVKLTYSPKYGKIMPLIDDVPGFTGIRIHPGNTEQDTSGCLLVGYGKTEDNKKITRSRDAFNDLFKILQQATDEGRPINITFRST